MANPDNKGTRIEGARAKGVAAAKAHKPRAANPYTRPNMSAAWLEGFDSVTNEDDSNEDAE